MPVISRFLGITIAMYWNDHLPPHYHAQYGKHKIIIDIATGLVTGLFPKRALRHVLKWHNLHQEELMANWEICRRKQMPQDIEPLE